VGLHHAHIGNTVRSTSKSIHATLAHSHQVQGCQIPPASYRRQIMDFATTHRLPTMGGGREFAEDGSFLAFGVSGRDLAQRAAVYVDKILKGVSPSDLPIE
jgi:hypothetical protein